MSCSNTATGCKPSVADWGDGVSASMKLLILSVEQTLAVTEFSQSQTETTSELKLTVYQEQFSQT